ncbi:hypothetical protein HanRHA438_Chr10g0430821 [Helianthus annuus]|nr:hypothetical protein HanOQP8_Chr10g0348051 [Helianthus annuus]KAJ0877649.1 hypothetical protein HanRHA438_Chr10g0430821 [Helianthus annuus]
MFIVPDRTAAFSDLFETAVVGRTVDLETLVDLDKVLRIAKTPFAKIHYLGGLSVLITFRDKVSAKSFLDSRDVWGPWFLKLDAWRGQCLSMERVVWLKLVGIPLHLLEPDVLLLVGELFGKVLHIPKDLSSDPNLSVCKVGILVGEYRKISDSVVMKWKDRSFRIWVEEEQEDWIPDCLDQEDASFNGDQDCSSPVKSSPVIQKEVSGIGGSGVGQHSEGLYVGEKSDGPEVEEIGDVLGSEDRNNFVPFHADSPMQVERENGGSSSVKKVGNFFGESVSNLSKVGPSIDCQVGAQGNVFFFSSKNKSKRGRKKIVLTQPIRKSRAQGSPNSSPNSLRPVKRSRLQMEEDNIFDKFVWQAPSATVMEGRGDAKGCRR